MESPRNDLPISTVRRVARLARLRLDDEALERHRAALSAVLGYMEALRELDLEGVEPMAHPSDAAIRLDADDVRSGLGAEALMKMAPASDPPFVRVPKVIGAED